MTITIHDGFALTPKRCSKCNRLFVLEFYDNYYKQVGFGYLDVMQIECRKCKKKEK